MFGGFSVAIALAQIVTFVAEPGRVRVTLLPYGIRSAVPIMIFLAVIGLRSAIVAPVDRRGSWLFSVIIGSPRSPHLEGTSIWITLFAIIIGTATALFLHALSPTTLRAPCVTAGQVLVAGGLSLLLSDIFLFSVRTIPFTQLRKGSVNDLPLAVIRYFVVFPFFVSIVVDQEAWLEASATHLFITSLAFAAAHLLLQRAHSRLIAQSFLDIPPNEVEEFPQGLGLRDS
jgi:hypothetical protein